MEPFDLQTKEELAVELGLRLRKLRLQKNFTQEAVAAGAGVSLRTLRSLEMGRGSSVETFLGVLKALGNARAIEFLAPTPTVSPMALLLRKNKKKPQQRAVTSRKAIERRRRELLDEFFEDS